MGALRRILNGMGGQHLHARSLGHDKAQGGKGGGGRVGSHMQTELSSTPRHDGYFGVMLFAHASLSLEQSPWRVTVQIRSSTFHVWMKTRITKIPRGLSLLC